MSLLNASTLWKSYGAEDIIQGISLSIPPQARIALLGANGVGKTTLLRMLIGEDAPTTGKIHIARATTIGYLPQEGLSILDNSPSTIVGSTAAVTTSTTLTLWEHCLSALEDLITLEYDLAAVASKLGEQNSSDNTEVLLTKYGSLQAAFEARGGYSYTYQIRIVLEGLGFSELDYAQPLHQLSSGQRTRAVLARLLLLNPSLLILDEPTNHLDMAAVEWLEDFLSHWQGATLLVSHDRYFLDKVCNVMWDMFPDRIEVYHGNYSAYLEQREARWLDRQKGFKTEKERLERELVYVRRNIAAQNTVQAKGKLRRLSRQIEALEQLGWASVQQKSWLQISQNVNTSMSMMSVEEAERRLRSLSLSQDERQTSGFHLHLRPQQRSGDIILRAPSVVIGYPEKPLFSADELLLRRLECAALIGGNGTGKTTFLKTLLNQVAPLEGEINLGASLRIGYFAQTHEELNPAFTLLEEIDVIKPDYSPKQLRQHLARFLFFGDDVYKQVKILSGGERSRLVLAKLALLEANLLLLDEPTNHLDIPSQELLQEVLAEYQGTIILVSHDRFLIDRLATQIWEIATSADDSPAKLQVFLGSYSEYHQPPKNSEAFDPPLPKKCKTQMQAQKAQKNRQQSSQRRQAARLIEVEEIIEKLDAERKELEEALANPSQDYAEVQKLGERYTACKTALEDIYQEWELLVEI